MDQPQNTPTGTLPEELPRTSEEVAREAVAIIERLVGEDDRQAAWDHFAQLHPADQAQALWVLSRENQGSLLAELEPSTVAAMLEYLEPEESTRLLRNSGPGRVAEILDLTGPDVAADLLHLLPETVQLETLRAMREAEEVGELLQYEDDTAGGLMTPDFPVVYENTTNPQRLGPTAATGSRRRNHRCGVGGDWRTALGRIGERDPAGIGSPQFDNRRHHGQPRAVGHRRDRPGRMR